jgi:IS30 family transposase
MAKNSHLSLDERIDIQDCLNHGLNFKQIGFRIKKDRTTVSKEIKLHLTVANQNCGNLCQMLIKPPFVCNGCKRLHGNCGFTKNVYYARHAHKAYRDTLVNSREGVQLNKEQFWENDRIISQGLRNGQHLYHIIKTNDLQVSETTVYRHMKKGILSAGLIDLPRAVKFKQRKSKRQLYIPKKLKIGRTFADFTAFCEQNHVNHWVEMDSVIGEIGGKAIVTFHFTFCNFMFGLLVDNKTAYEVAKVVSLVQNKLNFGELFPVILTDNGGEFSDVWTIEQCGSKLFFCDPLCSHQKARIEKNHTLFRNIVPQGQSFNSFTQETVNKIFSHVNNVKRKVLGGKSPYELFTFAYSTETATSLGIEYIKATDVIQTPTLLKRN